MLINRYLYFSGKECEATYAAYKFVKISKFEKTEIISETKGESFKQGMAGMGSMGGIGMSKMGGMSKMEGMGGMSKSGGMAESSKDSSKSSSSSQSSSKSSSSGQSSSKSSSKTSESESDSQSMMEQSSMFMGKITLSKMTVIKSNFQATKAEQSFKYICQKGGCIRKIFVKSIKTPKNKDDLVFKMRCGSIVIGTKKKQVFFFISRTSDQAHSYYFFQLFIRRRITKFTRSEESVGCRDDESLCGLLSPFVNGLRYYAFVCCDYSNAAITSQASTSTSFSASKIFTAASAKTKRLNAVVKSVRFITT